jgi:hypothetical protein
MKNYIEQFSNYDSRCYVSYDLLQVIQSLKYFSFQAKEDFIMSLSLYTSYNNDTIWSLEHQGHNSNRFKFTHNFFTIDKQGDILGYSLNYKKSITHKGKIKKTTAQVIKVNTFINHVMQHQRSSKLVRYVEQYEQCRTELIDQITSLLKSYKTTVIKPQITKEVHKIYNTPTSSSALAGILKNSCMRPESDYSCKRRSPFFDGVCEVVYQTDESGCLLYRALLWTLQNSPDKTAEDYKEIKFLDRVYGSLTVQKKLHSLAVKNGWYHRLQDTSHYIAMIDPVTLQNTPKIGPYYVFLTPEQVSLGQQGTPYLDSVNLYNIENGTLTHEKCNGSAADQILRDTGGCLHIKVPCKECGDTIRIRVSHVDTDECFCSSCRENGDYVDCEHCGDSICADDAIYVWDDRCYCSSNCIEAEDIYYCNHCDEYYDRNDGHRVSNYGFMCDDCTSDAAIYCEKCETYYLNEDADNYTMYDQTNISMCKYCFLENFIYCEHCDLIVAKEDVIQLETDCGQIDVCPHCKELYQECTNCGTLHEISERDLCELCNPCEILSVKQDEEEVLESVWEPLDTTYSVQIPEPSYQITAQPLFNLTV